MFVLYDWIHKLTLLEAEEYGHDGEGVYYKARRPGGGTIEVHVLEDSFFDDHPGRAWPTECQPGSQ